MSAFNIYRRKNKKSKIYYVRFKNADGTYSTAQSTGKKTRKDAIEWAEDEVLKNGGSLPGRQITFGEYSKDFFSWTGRWATNKKVEGRRIGERHCKDRTDLMRLHILPVFASYKLNDIDKTIIKNFRNDLFNKGCSGSLINKALYAIKTILEDAEDRGFIKAVPKITKALDNPKSKGILSIEEVNRLFSFEWMSKPSYSHPAKPQFMGYVGCLVLASTGLRISELQAIQINCLHLDDSYIVIRKAWDNRLNKLNNRTKTGRERNVFIPGKAKTAIIELLKQHPCPDNPEAFLFWGEKKPDEKPAEKKVFENAFFNALERVGINESERRRRVLSLHGFRYFLNSLLLNAKIPVQRVQSVIGHLSESMTSHYYKPDADGMQDVRQVQESIFGDPGNRTTH